MDAIFMSVINHHRNYDAILIKYITKCSKNNTVTCTTNLSTSPSQF